MGSRKSRNGKVILKQCKEELPTTWEECIASYSKNYYKLEYISSYSEISIIDRIKNSDIKDINKNLIPQGLGKPLLAFMQLLICREVYRNGWKPDWKSKSTKYTITCYCSKIKKSVDYSCNSILSFQHREIRDRFYKNFKNLIEEAKELL